MRLVASVCLSVWAVTFESLDLEILFLVCGYIFRISKVSRSGLCIRSLGQGRKVKVVGRGRVKVMGSRSWGHGRGVKVMGSRSWGQGRGVKDV